MKNKGENISENFILYDSNCLTLSFPSHYSYLEAANYIIEYAYVLKEPTFLNSQTYIYLEDSTITYITEYISDYYLKNNNDYIGKSSNFNIIIRYPLSNKY